MEDANVATVGPPGGAPATNSIPKMLIAGFITPTSASTPVVRSIVYRLELAP